MNPFYLMHCQPDPRQLTIWATKHHLLGPQGDLGYALHGLLRAAFGDYAPKPFSYADTRIGLLAYTRVAQNELNELAALAPPDVAGALGLDAGLRTRAFPQSWKAGQILGFSVRVRPVRRARDGRERDVFLPAIEKAERDAAVDRAAVDRAAVDRAAVDRAAVDRETVYREWLAQQLGAQGAARLLDASMTRFQLTKALRRTQAIEGSDDGRKVRFVCGPDATFAGHLQIDDPEAFARQVERGIGRHRAFGVGMLLLRPAASVD
jgi:CRISPR system Cascade subunit CasE